MTIKEVKTLISKIREKEYDPLNNTIEEISSLQKMFYVYDDGYMLEYSSSDSSAVLVSKETIDPFFSYVSLNNEHMGVCCIVKGIFL